MSELASHFGQAPAPIWSKLQSWKSHKSYPVGTTLARGKNKADTLQHLRKSYFEPGRYLVVIHLKI